MNITIGRYGLYNNVIYIEEPFEVKKETEKYYWSGMTKSGAAAGNRILKEEIGIVKHLSRTSYPYLEVAMIDATEQEVKERLASWFRRTADYIINR